MKTLIIGGGLSGLALAETMQARGHDYILIDARDRFGGRIMTERYSGANFDMGPAWFWPHQPRIEAMITRLGLKKFDQYSDGIATFEDEQGHVQHSRGFASMQGSRRLKGGLTALTQSLADGLPEERKRLNAPVISLIRQADGITAELSNGDKIQANQVVLALPPRIAANIGFSPALSDATLKTLRNVPTWMAGQAKAVAVYHTPFWRDAGLSGDAASRIGPMVEIHDASPANDGPYALFGFIGIPPEGRRDAQMLRQQLRNQLERLFGSSAANPAALFIKDWAVDAFTSTDADQAPLYSHPKYHLHHTMANLWNRKLHFAGTEVASQFGGYVEGAIEAAENAITAIEQQIASV